MASASPAGPRLSRRAVIGSAGVAALVAAGFGIRAATTGHPEDTYFVGNQPWFDRHVENADNYHRYTTVKEAVAEADVILLGHITGAQATRSSTGEVDTDVVYYGGYVVAVDELISGRLTDSEADEIVVELVLQDTDFATDARSADRTAPKGRALWILRSNQEIVEAQVEELKAAGRYSGQRASDLSAAEPYYQPVGVYQGVFLQGREHVESPFDPDPDTRLGSEASTFTKLSSLVDHVRAS